MTETAKQNLEIKSTLYHKRVAKNPEYKQKESIRVSAFIMAKYNNDPEYKERRLEYQRNYDRAKAEAKRILKQKNIVIPEAIPV
jgi:hypothetical protein